MLITLKQTAQIFFFTSFIYKFFSYELLKIKPYDTPTGVLIIYLYFSLDHCNFKFVEITLFLKIANIINLIFKLNHIFFININ